MILDTPQDYQWGQRLAWLFARLHRAVLACSSDRTPHSPDQGLVNLCTGHRTPTMGSFFIVSPKCCSEVTSIPPTVCSGPDPFSTLRLLYHRPRIWLLWSPTICWNFSSCSGMLSTFSITVFNISIILILNSLSDSYSICIISESDSVFCFASWHCTLFFSLFGIFLMTDIM